jgi:hypothetical protein
MKGVFMTETFLLAARRVAERNRYDQVTPEHLLYALLQDQAYRSETQNIGLDPDEMTSLLTAGFAFHRSGRLLGPVRVPVKKSVLSVLDQTRRSGGRLLPAVLELFHEDPSGLEPAPRPVQKLPELDDLLEDLERERGHMGFDQICKDVFHKDVRGGKYAPAESPVSGGVGAETADPGATVRGGQPDRTSLSGKERAEAQRAVERAIRDLTALHRAGRLDPVIGRDREIDRVCEVLMRRRKSNVLLVGEPGVGKTALMEGVAARVSDASDPALSSRPVLQASLGGLVAGARYRGDFEIRMEILVEMATERHAILFFDEMQMLIGSGSTADRGMDGANLLKPVLARDGISLVGATTLEEAKLLRSDPALMRRFEELLLEEPGAELMREILRGGAPGYLSHHRVRADERLLGRVVDFADLYLPDRRFPDKAFDLLDSACVRARVSGRTVLRVEDIRGAVRQLGGALPDLSRMSAQEAEARVAGLTSQLERHVGGHRGAIRDLASAVVGRDPSTPLLLHLDGPKGVGRRTLARALARSLGGPFREADAADGAGPTRAALLEAAGSPHTTVLLLNAGGSVSAEVSEVLDQLTRNGTLEAPTGKEVGLGRCIIMIRSDHQRNKPGFSLSGNDCNNSHSEIQKIFMRPFSGENLIDGISFERERLVRIFSDAGSSRPIPDAESMASKVGPVIYSWSALVHACRRLLEG